MTADEKDTCCKGIFNNNIGLVAGGTWTTSNTDRFASSGCFCIEDIMNEDIAFFNAVLDIAKT